VTLLSHLQSTVWTDYISNIIMQLIQFPLQQNWILLKTRKINLNVRQIVQSN
jgi:hypothetical protein